MDGMIALRGRRYPVALAIENAQGATRGFATWLLDLPGCIAQGTTAEDARERLEAIAEPYVEALERLGAEVPMPTELPAVLPGPMAFYNPMTGQSMYLVPGDLPEPPSLVDAPPGYRFELCQA